MVLLLLFVSHVFLKKHNGDLIYKITCFIVISVSLFHPEMYKMNMSWTMTQPNQYHVNYTVVAKLHIGMAFASRTMIYSVVGKFAFFSAVESWMVKLETVSSRCWNYNDLPKESDM